MNEQQTSRPSWDEYFMMLARLISSRSTCLRRKVGAVLVREKRVLATGYNGAPSKMAHCLDTGCLREKRGIPSGKQQEICRGIHAEQNAIIQAAHYGISIAGSKIYINTHPCILCAKMLINAGVVEIIYEGDYPDSLAENMLKEAKVRIRQFKLQHAQTEGSGV